VSTSITIHQRPWP